MDPTPEDLIRTVLIGLGATGVMNAWLLLLKRLNVPTLNFAFVGRWLGHLARGTFRHAAISKAAPVRGERALGWLFHYATGIAFAALLVAVAGTDWMQRPSPLPALAVGLGTVVAPLFLLQPALGAGIASSRTPTPVKNCLRSVATHFVFGVGLYVSGVWVERLLG